MSDTIESVLRLLTIITVLPLVIAAHILVFIAEILTWIVVECVGVELPHE